MSRMQLLIKRVIKKDDHANLTGNTRTMLGDNFESIMVTL
jgi:hypothetical protein